MGEIDVALEESRRYFSQSFAEGAIQCGICKILDKQSCLMSSLTFSRRSRIADSQVAGRG